MSHAGVDPGEVGGVGGGPEEKPLGRVASGLKQRVVRPRALAGRDVLHPAEQSLHQQHQALDPRRPNPATVAEDLIWYPPTKENRKVDEGLPQLRHRCFQRRDVTREGAGEA
jgi:hypothetical protein